MRNLIKFFITVIIIFSTFSSHSKDLNLPKNLIIHEKLKKYENVSFKNRFDKDIDLANFNGKLLLLNFWATWCEPCKEEMPSLDKLQTHENLDNLKIFPINVGQDSKEKSLIFFKELEIKNIEIYFDSPVTLAKKLGLRGIPTSILFNKEGFEFARIIGSINFEDKKFIKWLSNYN